MIYINNSLISTSQSNPYVLTSNEVVGRFNAEGLDELANIYGDSVQSFGIGVKKPNGIDFKVKLNTEITTATKISVVWLNDKWELNEESFWVRYVAVEPTNPIYLFTGTSTTVNVTTTTDEAEIAIDPRNVARFEITQGSISRATIDLDGKMAFVTIDPSLELIATRTDVIKVRCFDSYNNFNDFYIYVEQDNTNSPTVGGDILSSLTTTTLTFTNHLTLNGTNATITRSEWTDAPEWLHLSVGDDDLHLLYTTDKNETPVTKTAVVPFYFTVEGLSYKIRRDVTFKSTPSTTAIYIDGSLEPNRDFYVNSTKGSSITIPFILANVNVPVTLSAVSDLYKVFDVTIDQDLRIITFTAIFDNESSETEQEFTGLSLVGYDADGNEVRSPDFTIIQRADSATIQFPVWRREVLEIKPIDFYLDYRLIGKDNEIIYQGRAYAIDTVVTISLNEIIRPYITQHFNITQIGWNDTNGYGKFKLQVLNENGVYDDYMTIRAFNDWSYTVRTKNTSCLQDPIFRTLDYRQKAIFSVIDRYGEYADASKTRAWVSKVTDSEGIKYYDSIDANNQMASIVVNDLTDCSEVSCIYSHIGQDLEVDYEDVYKVECTPYKYALYYHNLIGGYDSVLCNKASTTSIQVKSTTFINDVGFESKDHETNQYRKAITHKYKVILPKMNDEQSAKVKHIVTSNQMWLHNLETNEIVPVIIDDATTQVKSFVTNGRKFTVYTLNLTESFTELRY